MLIRIALSIQGGLGGLALIVIASAALPTVALASPDGTNYSVHHRVGADLDGNGPNPITCFYIHDKALPGAPDDIVTFDGVVEPIRTDDLGTVPMVIESDTAQPNGRRMLTIETVSPLGTDLFPDGFLEGGMPLTDACFSIGLHDALTWIGSDSVIDARIEFLIDGVPSTPEPLDAISFFSDPWDGEAEITLPNGAGSGFNGVRLMLLTEKNVQVPNDRCRLQQVVTDGDTPFSTIGATTDGPDEFGTCRFASYSQIGTDIWYRYSATCTGNLTVDLCDSDYDTKVAVYDSPNCSVSQDCPVESPPLGCNDDFQPCGLRSFVTVPVVIGQCYTVRIGGYQAVEGTGTMTLSCDVVPPPSGACCDDGVCFGTQTEVDCLTQSGTWFVGASCPGFDCPVSPPPNDECSDCIRVETGVAYEGRTRAATGTDVSSCGFGTAPDTLDAWNCWTADCTGRVSITTCGSSFDTTLAVYEGCGGLAGEIACDSEGCPMLPAGRSKVTIDVTEGTTYFIRVAGDKGLSGDYTLLVEQCKNACCLSTGLCGLATEAQCLAHPAGGTYLGPGTLCAGDVDGNGINDACETCPQATIAAAAPLSGTVDARQPCARNIALPRHGIGSPGGGSARRESIVLLLDPPLPDAEGCFEVCETKDDPLVSTNAVGSVTYHGAGVYELVLDHAISAGGVTTIEYLGDGSFVEYIAHPGNVDPEALPSQANAADVGAHVNCCLSGHCEPAWGLYSCDNDRSLVVTPADTLAVIDFMNGTQIWDVWLGTPLPTRGDTCPP